MRLVKNSKKLSLQLIVTGSHLAPEFGFTLQQIENDGFKVDSKIEILQSSDSEVGTSSSQVGQS